jgi:hypothetical protein
MSPLPSPAADLARRLAERAEAVCRAYLSNGRRCGRYWSVGDIANGPGRSLYVRLHGPTSGPGAAGHWTDAATSEHGDLLDLIRLACGLPGVREAIVEARAFLALPPPMPRACRDLRVPASRSTVEAARRLFRAGRPISGTPAAAYLAHRGLAAIASPWLRYHPSCYVRISDEASRQTWPALLAAITDVHGVVRGVHRTWLDPSGCGLAPIRAPRRSLGEQLGHGVRFGGFAAPLLVAGEGLETVLSVRAVLPRVPMLAGLSANHLAAVELPGGVQRLYIARDGDAAGTRAAERLRTRAEAAGILDVRNLYPMHGDFNDDLRRLGAAWLAGHVAVQLDPADVRWLCADASGETARAA